MADDFNSVSQKLFTLYNAGDYSQALRIANTLALQYPGEVELTAFWQVCLLTRLGETQRAIQTLDNAVQDGLWWTAAMLREDEDLAPLQDLPEFNRLIQICRDRHTAAQAAGKPGLRTVRPEGNFPSPYPLLIVLHGRRSSAAQALPYWRLAAGLGWFTALPQSSQVAGRGKYSWDDDVVAQGEIEAHLARLREEVPLDPEKVVLAGFSQGGALAMQLAIDGCLGAAGFLAVVPGLLTVERLKQTIQASNVTGVRGYLLAGSQDPRYETLRELHTLLNQQGFLCKMENHPQLGHAYPADFQTSLALGLQFLTGQDL